MISDNDFEMHLAMLLCRGEWLNEWRLSSGISSVFNFLSDCVFPGVCLSGRCLRNKYLNNQRPLTVQSTLT